jgi:transposase
MPKGKLTIESRLRQQVTRLTNLLKRYKARIAELLSVLKERDREIIALKQQVADKEAQRKQLLSYLYKPKRKKPDSKKPGKQPGSKGHHRPQPKEDEVTGERSFPLHICPHCKHPLEEAADTQVKFEEDIDLAPQKRVTKYIIPRYWCGRCDMFVRSPEVPAISRIGPNVLAYILYMRYRLRIPMDKIKESLTDLHNFEISTGEISEKLAQSQELFGKDYEAIIELIRTARVVYADETGWRMNGENWWLWVFVTNKGEIRYVLEDTRGKGVAEEALGTTNRDRVIVSDGYAVYASLPGEHQQCWVHLFRVAKPASFLLYTHLVQLYECLGIELTKPVSERDPPGFEAKLRTIMTAKYSEPEAEKVQARIRHHFDMLLTCIRFEGVLPENNTAERAIRPAVVMRKIFGGSRSLAGAHTHEVNTSVIETLLRQNPHLSFFEVIPQLLEKRRDEQKAKKQS